MHWSYASTYTLGYTRPALFVYLSIRGSVLDPTRPQYGPVREGARFWSRAPCALQFERVGFLFGPLGIGSVLDQMVHELATVHGTESILGLIGHVAA